jgi:hypothetical protein
MTRTTSAFVFVLLGAAFALAQTRPPVSVKLGADGKLVYESDPLGNRVIDFSHAGYAGGGRAIPDVPVKIYLGPGDGDQRGRIQAAVDLVSAMPPDSDGFRGAVLLKRGTYRMDSQVRIKSSGVVLRGEGDGEDGTVLVAAGTSRRTLIVVEGEGGRAEIKGSRRAVADRYVPVGAKMKYRAWREYRDSYPGLVLLSEADEYPELSRAVERASPAAVRAAARPSQLVLTHEDTAWALADPGRDYLVYSTAGGAVELDLSRDGHAYTVSWLDSSTGRLQKSAGRVGGGGAVTLAPPRRDTGRPWVAWLTAVR